MDSLYRWEFCCKEGDIDFAVYESKDNAKIPVVPKDRVECHITPEVGQISIDPGQCKSKTKQIKTKQNKTKTIYHLTGISFFFSHSRYCRVR